MANTRILKGRVAVGGVWYGPGPVPDDIAEQITNPKAWASEQDGDDMVADIYDRRTGTSTGARLAGRVAVDGHWYGPDSEVSDDVARKITNPKAWEGGVLPSLPDTEPDFDAGGELPSGVTGGAAGVQIPVVEPETGEPEAEPETEPEPKAGKKPAKKS